MVKESSEISLREKESFQPSDEMAETSFAKPGCCSWIPCLGTSDQSSTVGSVWWENLRTAEKEERWWTRGWKAFKKAREWSELVAGPRWKTFIRRFNKNRGCCNGVGGTGGVRAAKFQYDPLSYSLNFDEGKVQLDDDYASRDFSSRYASIPASAKSSMDLGKDGPSFT